MKITGTVLTDEYIKIKFFKLPELYSRNAQAEQTP